MSNASRALSARLVRATRNDSLLFTTSANGHFVNITADKADKPFAVAIPDANGFTLYAPNGYGKAYGALSFGELVADIKSLPGYPAPKVHKVRATPRIRHTQMTGVSMGRFIPGNLSAIES